MNWFNKIAQVNSGKIQKKWNGRFLEVYTLLESVSIMELTSAAENVKIYADSIGAGNGTAKVAEPIITGSNGAVKITCTVHGNFPEYSKKPETGIGGKPISEPPGV